MPKDTFTDFAVHSAPTRDGGTEITVYGELDLATVDDVKAKVDEAIEGSGHVIIDLRACPFVDSRGIGVIAHAAVGLKNQSRELRLRGVQPRVKRTLDISGLTKSHLITVEAEPDASP